MEQMKGGRECDEGDSGEGIYYWQVGGGAVGYKTKEQGRNYRSRSGNSRSRNWRKWKGVKRRSRSWRSKRKRRKLV